MVSLRKSKCKRNMRGGGAGGSYVFAPSSLSSVTANPLAYAPASNCQLSGGTRFGTVPNIDTGGIPGLKGGRRLRKKRNTRRQRGGSYGMAEYDGTVGGFPGASGIAGIVNNGCSAPSQTALHDSGASGALNSHTSELWQKGGAQLNGSLITEADAPLSAANAPASLSVPTAAYTNLNNPASVGGSSTGVPYMINVPIDGRGSSIPAGESSASMKGGRRSRRRNNGARRSASRVNRKRSRRTNCARGVNRR